MVYSLYERGNQRRNEQSMGLCLGKITDVNAAERTCTISTMFGSGSMNDQYVKGVQWLSSDVNPEGDESGSIPRRGSLCMVAFIEGQPFIIGFFRPVTYGGSAASGMEGPTLQEGDKAISTRSKNWVRVAISGLIELVSSTTLQRVMIPIGSKIVDVCRYFILRTDGGSIDWGTEDALLQSTKYTAEYRKDLARSSILVEQKGYVSSDTISRSSVGVGIPGVKDVTLPSYNRDVKITGEVITTVTPPSPRGAPVGYKSTISPDGSVELKFGALQTTTAKVSTMGAVELSVNKIATAKISESGEVSVENKLASIKMTATGDITIKGPTSTITVSAAGEVKVDAAAKLSLAAKAGVDIKSTGGDINVESVTGNISVKATTGQISIQAGGMPLEAVLTTPTTLSPFTGAPLMPGSKTVMVST